MRVAAAKRARAIVRLPLVSRTRSPVQVIRDGLDVRKRVLLKMLAALAEVAGALNHVIEVRDDAGGHKHLAVVVPIDAPLVASAFGEDLKSFRDRMQSPHAGVERSAFLGRAA